MPKLLSRTDWRELMDKIVVTEVQIVPVKFKNGLVAFASCVINGQFYLGDIAIYSSPLAVYGYRLVYPNRILLSGKNVNCFYPITRDAGECLQKAIVTKYKNVMEKVMNNYGEIYSGK